MPFTKAFDWQAAYSPSPWEGQVLKAQFPPSPSTVPPVPPLGTPPDPPGVPSPHSKRVRTLPFFPDGTRPSRPRPAKVCFLGPEPAC